MLLVPGLCLFVLQIKFIAVCTACACILCLSVLDTTSEVTASLYDSVILQFCSCLAGLGTRHAIIHADTLSGSCLFSGCAGKLVVVFMHNLPSGHEKSMRPAGVNNTDPGRWQQFSQQCHQIVNMAFDETRWQWHDVNQAAAQSIIAAIKQLVKTHPDQTSAGATNVMASS